MARIRSIKPEFFKDDKLAELSYAHRFLFQGLWLLADREGRLQDKPKWIRVEVFPYDHEMDVDSMLNDLSENFITRYQVSGKSYIQVKNFLKHQKPHHTEKTSEIPYLQDNGEAPDIHGEEPVGREGKGREGKGEVKAQANVQTSSSRSPKLSDHEWIDLLKANPAYRGINVDRELSKMDAWLQSPKGKGRQKTRGFVLNWLNKIDVPMLGGKGSEDKWAKLAKKHGEKLEGSDELE